ncbi:MAG: hydroxyacid dehydrogenase [Clostridia bacterium]|nr:hydroxyacid dehydrogenase [Clostridia bacterium]
MKFLVTGAFNCTEKQLSAIKKICGDVVFMQQESESLPCDYSEIEGVICNGLFLYHDIKKFTNLKYIQLTSAGYDRVPMNEVNRLGIKIFNARGVYSVPMAEFALTGVLSLYKGFKSFYKNQESRVWVKNREVKELCSQTVVVVGAGSVGTECAKRFKAMGCKVLGVDLFVRSDENFEVIYPLDKLDYALSLGDVVVLTLPLSSETKGLFSKDKFSVMKKGATLVNISRGAVVDETALISALKSGALYGACLDVFDFEPLPADSPLWNFENVIITPHNSFVGNGNNERLFNLILENIGRV